MDARNKYRSYISDSTGEYLNIMRHPRERINAMFIDGHAGEENLRHLRNTRDTYTTDCTGTIFFRGHKAVGQTFRENPALGYSAGF